MPPCILCPSTNRSGSMSLGEAGWLCRRCIPPVLPPYSTPAELRLLLVLGKAQALTASQAVIIGRLGATHVAHSKVRGMEEDLAQLRKLGLVESVGGTARRTHRLTEAGLTLKGLLGVKV